MRYVIEAHEPGLGWILYDHATNEVGAYRARNTVARFTGFPVRIIAHYSDGTSRIISAS